MKLFNLYTKIIRHSFYYAYRVILSYILFLFLSVPFVSNMNSGIADAQKVTVVFINEDKDNTLINNLYAYLSEYCNFKTVQQNKDSIMDALYYEKAQCVLKVPAGFSDKMINGEPAKLELKTMNKENMDVIVSHAANQYLKAVEQEKIHTETDLEHASNAVLMKITNRNEFTLRANNIKDKTQLTYFFNLLSYVVLSITIVVIGSANFRLRQGKLLNKIKIAPTSIQIFRCRILLASIFFVTFLTSILILIGLLLFGRQGLQISTLLTILNVFVFILCAVSIAFIIGICIKSMRYLPVILNVVTLTMCFLSGAILEQQNMSPIIEKISSLFPVYWYVKNNIEINNVSAISSKDYVRFFNQLGIILLFTIVNLVIACIIDDKKVKLEG